MKLAPQPESHAFDHALDCETPPQPVQLGVSKRAYSLASHADSWEEIWEAASYYQQISELLEDAQHYAVFVGWQVDSRLPLPRPQRGTRDEAVRSLTRSLETLKEKVIRLCESKPDFQIYFLIWDHAYFYVLEREQMQGRIWDDIHPRVHFLFDNRYPYGGSHHEKIAIIDGTTAYCGGIDLCDERWDTPQHRFVDRRRSLDWKREHHGPYHDLAVRVTGPICAAIHEHIARRWRLLSSIPFPELPLEARTETKARHQVYLSRTIAHVDGGERGEGITREIEFLFRDLISQAEERIILEGQYYWSEKLNDLLIAKIHQMKGRNFEVYLILAETRDLKSLTRQMAYHEMKLLKKLEAAGRTAGVKVVIGAPYVLSGTSAPPRSIYVHSKILIVDQKYFSIGSANLASRAFRLDTELNLTLEARTPVEEKYIRETAERVLRHWNLHEEPANPVHLRRFDCALELKRLGRRSPWLSRIPWQYFFDPVVPWLYPLKRRYRKWTHTRSWLAFSGMLFVWGLGVSTSLWIFSLVTPDPLSSTSPTSWWAIYGVLLTSAWLLPLPFLALGIFASIQLGPHLGPELVTSAFWTASLWGYVLTRMFPTPMSRFFRKTSPPWLPERIGMRSFPYLISVLADPRVSIRSKIAYQGLYCVPLPWFILGNLLFLGSALYSICRWTSGLTQNYFMSHAQFGHEAKLASLAPVVAGSVILWGFAAIVFGLRNEKRS
ncbi:MAG: hypothetical protein H7222_12275 [Methylotenera sp.]|nr:hypothetical protein [Oligoflexia bacterium]